MCVAEYWLAAGDCPVRSYLIGRCVYHDDMPFILFSIILCRTHAAVIFVCALKCSHAHGPIQLAALLYAPSDIGSTKMCPFGVGN